MRRLLIALLITLLLCSAPAMAQTPTLLQSKTDAAEASTLTTTRKVNLPNPSQGGNCLVAVVAAGQSGATLSVTDDKTNTWTSTTQVNDAGNNTTLQIFYALNVASGTQLITINFAASLAFNQVQLMEFNNVATASALDVETGRTTSGTSIATAAMTTTVNGDLIIHAAVLSGWPTQSAPMSWTPGSGFTIAAIDNASYMATQQEVQVTSGSITPSITSSINSTGAMTKAIALKSAAAGSANPAGIRVRKVAVQTLENGTSYATYAGTSFTFQLPVDGNLIALGWTGDGNVKLTTITSSPSLTWSSTTASKEDPRGVTGKSVWWWYAVGATPNTLYAITLSGFPSTPLGTLVNLFDISGADSSPFDLFADSNGANNTNPTPGQTGVLINGPSITPTTSNGLVLAVQQQYQHTIVNATPGYFEAMDVGVYSGSSGDADEGLLAYYNPNTSAVQVVWNYSGYQGGTTGVSYYCSQAIAFKAPTAGAATPAINKRAKLATVDGGAL